YLTVSVPQSASVTSISAHVPEPAAIDGSESVCSLIRFPLASRSCGEHQGPDELVPPLPLLTYRLCAMTLLSTLTSMEGPSPLPLSYASTVTDTPVAVPSSAPPPPSHPPASAAVTAASVGLAKLTLKPSAGRPVGAPIRTFILRLKPAILAPESRSGRTIFPCWL